MTFDETKDLLVSVANKFGYIATLKWDSEDLEYVVSLSQNNRKLGSFRFDNLETQNELEFAFMIGRIVGWYENY